MAEIDLFIAAILFVFCFLVGALAATLSNPITRTKILRRFQTGKDLGLIAIVRKSKKIALKIQDYAEPIYLYKGMTFDPQKANPYADYTLMDVPVLFYNETDSSPLTLEPDRKEDAARFNSDPSALSSGFLAYKSLKEREANMRANRDRILILIAAGASALTLYFVWTYGDKLNELTTLLKHLTDLANAYVASQPKTV